MEHQLLSRISAMEQRLEQRLVQENQNLRSELESINHKLDLLNSRVFGSRRGRSAAEDLPEDLPISLGGKGKAEDLPEDVLERARISRGRSAAEDLPEDLPISLGGKGKAEDLPEDVLESARISVGGRGSTSKLAIGVAGNPEAGEGSRRSTKVNTELCQYFMSGHCKKGDACTYAHGHDQLVRRQAP